MALPDLPALLKHMTLAILDTGKYGSGAAAFGKVFSMVRGILVGQGFLVAGSEDGDIAKIKLTSKGMLQNKKHLNEGVAKNKRFDKLFEKIQVAVEMPKQPNTKPDAPPDRDQAKEQRKQKSAGKYVT